MAVDLTAVFSKNKEKPMKVQIESVLVDGERNEMSIHTYEDETITFDLTDIVKTKAVFYITNERKKK
jgi:hypothetical protein